MTEKPDFLHETALTTYCNVFLFYYYWNFPIKAQKYNQNSQKSQNSGPDQTTDP